jgi:hypothetical protein
VGSLQKKKSWRVGKTGASTRDGDPGTYVDSGREALAGGRVEHTDERAGNSGLGEMSRGSWLEWGEITTTY